MFKSVANGSETDSPSLIKEFNAISLEANNDWDVNLSTSNDRSQVRQFTDYEGVKYASIPRSTASRSGNSSQFFSLGTVSPSSLIDQLTGIGLASEATITLDKEIKHFVPVGDEVEIFYIRDQGDRAFPLFFSTKAVVTKIEGKSITIKRIQGLSIGPGTVDPQATSQDSDDSLDLFVQADSLIYGDQLRDSYATVTCVTDTQDKAELYAVNLEYTQSKLDPTT